MAAAGGRGLLSADGGGDDAAHQRATRGAGDDRGARRASRGHGAVAAGRLRRGGRRRRPRLPGRAPTSCSAALALAPAWDCCTRGARAGARRAVGGADAASACWRMRAALERLREPARPRVRADHRRRAIDALRRDLPRGHDDLRPEHAFAREALEVHPPSATSRLPRAREGVPRRRRRTPPGALARRRHLGRVAPKPARLPAGRPVAYRGDDGRQSVADVGADSAGAFGASTPTAVATPPLLVVLAFSGLLAGPGANARRAILALAC